MRMLSPISQVKKSFLFLRWGLRVKIKTVYAHSCSFVNILYIQGGVLALMFWRGKWNVCGSEILAKCPESILWIQWEPLIRLLGRGLGVIADNGKWEMGNATNKRKEKYKIGSREWCILFTVLCVPRKLGTGHSLIN